MSYSRYNGIPVTKAVLRKYFLNKLRLIYLSKLDILCLTVCGNNILAFLDIVLFKLCLKPLINLSLSLCALYNIQPVTAWSLRVL